MIEKPQGEQLRLLTEKELTQPPYNFCSRSTLWRWIKNGEFPRPVKFGRFNKWYLYDIEKWLQDKRDQQIQH